MTLKASDFDPAASEALPPKVKKFGPLQGLILVAGMMLTSLLGSMFVGIVWGIHLAVLDKQKHLKPLHHIVKHLAAAAPPQMIALSALAGSFLSILWVFGYILYKAGPLLTLGGARGIAWKSAKPRGYLVAFFLSLLALLCVLVGTQLYPPDVKNLTGPIYRLSVLPGLSHLALILLAVVIAPIVEELTFRGALLASLARRYSTTTAVIWTTLIFVALHAPDKIHYWPGFIDVGILALFAAYVRLKYDSLRPAMLLHFCYNGSLLFLSGLAPYLAHH